MRGIMVGNFRPRPVLSLPGCLTGAVGTITLAIGRGVLVGAGFSVLFDLCGVAAFAVGGSVFVTGGAVFVTGGAVFITGGAVFTVGFVVAPFLPGVPAFARVLSLCSAPIFVPVFAPPGLGLTSGFTRIAIFAVSFPRVASGVRAVTSPFSALSFSFFTKKGSL